MLQNHRETVKLCLRWYSHQYQDIPREMQLLPDLLSYTMSIKESPFAHTWMQAFLNMQTEPEKAVAFRQAIIQSVGQTLAFMARAIDEHHGSTSKYSPHEMYRNPNDKRLGLEFQKTWKNNFDSPNACIDHIRDRLWPFQDSRFQRFYAQLPYPAEPWSKDNPFGFEVYDHHLEEVRNDAGQQLGPTHCFMYFYRYNFARALLNLVEHAFVGEAEDQFPTFGDFVQSALGKNIQFALLNELTMTKVIRDDKPDNAHEWFDKHIKEAGPTWNYAAKFLLKAFTADEATKEAYAATEALDWPLRMLEFTDNTQNLKTMMPVCNSNYVWIITVVKNPDRYHPIFNADYELLYLFCKEAYRHVIGHRKLGGDPYYEGGWSNLKYYKHPDTSEIETLPLYTHVVFESIHWLCEESLDPGDIRAIMRTPIPKEDKDSVLTQEQVENAEFFYNWINMIQELVKNEVEPYAEARGPEAVRTRSKQYYKPQRKNPKFNPKLRQKLDALNSAYERPFTLVARYRMATDRNELFESLADDGLEGGFVDEIEDSRLLQHIKRQRTAAAMLTDGLLSKMCELKL